MENRSCEKEEIAAGDQMGTLVKKPDLKQVFMFSAATWNRHAIHYSRETARREGLPDVVVQRALIGNFLAQFLEAWAADRGQVRRLEWKVVHSAVPGDTLTCSGVVTKVMEGQGVECDLALVNQDNDTIAKASATVGFDA